MPVFNSNDNGNNTTCSNACDHGTGHCSYQEMLSYECASCLPEGGVIPFETVSYAHLLCLFVGTPVKKKTQPGANLHLHRFALLPLLYFHRTSRAPPAEINKYHIHARRSTILFTRTSHSRSSSFETQSSNTGISISERGQLTLVIPAKHTSCNGSR